MRNLIMLISAMTKEELLDEAWRNGEEIIRLRAELAETKEVATECMRARQDDAVEIARLRESLLTSPCPCPPQNGIYTVEECQKTGDCGCDNRAALAPRP